MQNNGRRRRVRRKRRKLKFYANYFFVSIISCISVVPMEEDEAQEDNEVNVSLNAEVYQDIRDQMQGIAVSPRQTELPTELAEVPPGDVGVIFTSNAREDITPLTINLDEPIGNALVRAVGNNRFHFELKDGTQLDNSKTFRQAGVVVGDAIRLCEGCNDSGYFGTPFMVSPASSVSSETETIKEIVEDRIETPQEIDKVLASAMESSGSIVVTQTNGDLNEVHVENNDAIHQIIARAVGTTDNEEYDLYDGNRILPRNSTVRDSGIRFRSNLKLVERPVNVFVRCVDSKSHCIQARRSDTVTFVKEALTLATNVPLHQHRLQFESKPLEDNVQLRKYGIRNNSHIESTYRLRGGAN